MDEKVLKHLYATIAQRLRDKRSEKHLSQENVADQIKLARTSIVNFEKGRQRLPIHVVYQIAEFLNAPIDGIFPSIEELKQFEKQPSVELVDFHGHQVKPKTAAYLEKQLTIENENEDEQKTNAAGKKKSKRTS